MSTDLKQFLLSGVQGFHFEWSVAILGDRKCGKSAIVHALLNNSSAADSTPLHAVRIKFLRPHQKEEMYCQIHFHELCCRDVSWQPLAKTCVTAVLLVTSRYQLQTMLRLLHTSTSLKTMHSVVVVVLEGTTDCDIDSKHIDSLPKDSLPRDISVVRVDLRSPPSIALLRRTLVEIVVGTFHSSLEPALLPRGVVMGSLVTMDNRVVDEYAGKLGGAGTS